MTCVAATLCAGGEGDAPVQDGKGPLTWGGAKGTRTPNPLLAKQVRYQLRHGPRSGSGAGDVVRRLGPEGLLALTGLGLLARDHGGSRREGDEEELLHRCSFPVCDGRLYQSDGSRRTIAPTAKGASGNAQDAQI